MTPQMPLTEGGQIIDKMIQFPENRFIFILATLHIASHESMIYKG